MSLETSSSNTFKLNPQQEEAVKCLEGPLLISAGAGSGKTQVLTTRIANVLSKGLATANEVLAVTFTNKAAQEMVSRISRHIPDMNTPEPIWVHTFHAMSARILRENIPHLAPRTQVTIYDTSDQLSLIKKIMKDKSIEEAQSPAKGFQQQISMCKRMAISPVDTENHPTLRFTPDFGEFYQTYEEELVKASAFDFEGLLFEMYKLLDQNPDVLSYYQKKFKYICIDEYQDTNHIQYLLILLLAQDHQNICVVGDEDQSIYSWRGADITNILNFEKDFPNCKTIKLEQNYRSTQSIVSAASSLIGRNDSRKNKILFTENDTGDLVRVQSHYNDLVEAKCIARNLFYLCESGEFSFNDIAIFYRTNAQSRLLEDQLRARSVPYEIVGNLKFYDRAEIKDIISYLKVISNSNDEIALRRSLGVPRRGIGKSTLDKANVFALQNNISLYEALTHLTSHAKIPKKAARAFFEYRETMESLKEKQSNISIYNLYSQVLNDSGFLPSLEAQNTIESSSKIDNLAELGNAIQQFEDEKPEASTLNEFLEEMSLLSAQTNELDSTVKLMTLHLSKGLEFDVVFIAGLEEGLFPLIHSVDDTDIEEERRLAYVGMTRARKKLYLSYAHTRRRFGIEKRQLPSRFLKEISKDYLEVIDPPRQGYF